MLVTGGNRLVCGIPEEWKHFEEQHGLFFERFPHLESALETTFIRTTTLSEPIDKFVLQYGRLCVEDFFEILLNCANGYGIAGQKLLRGLYERAVTLAYLDKYPEELDAFIDFQKVQDYKVVRSIEDTIAKGTISENTVADVKARRDEVMHNFMVTDCKVCGTERLNHSWSKMNFVAMSQKVESLGKLIVPGYYVPLKHAHATFGAMSSRLEVTKEGTVSFVPTAQRKEAAGAFMVAHNILLQVLGVEDERFKVEGLEEKLRVCMGDFLEIWRKKEKAPPSEG